MDVTIKVTGLKGAINDIQGVGDRISNVGPVARDIMLAVQADVDQRFDDAPKVESDGIVWGGVTWPHLSAKYLNANPRRVGGQQLRDTGELQQSYGLGSVGNVALTKPDQIVFGSALPKARGLANKRPQVFIHPALIQVVTNIVEHYVAGGLQ